MQSLQSLRLINYKNNQSISTRLGQFRDKIMVYLLTKSKEMILIISWDI